MLTVDLGVNEKGHRDHAPRARYECQRCRTTEGPVEGSIAVTTFIEHVRAVHATRCHPTQESASA
ncbi:hypothetical protein ACFW4X_10910 [Streptomyces smyrnaeus]|uniref:hypothetical protein n=1 Tax=Streptomyces smyrnaeus TaxID=1387713 RepID=UPI00367F412E